RAVGGGAVLIGLHNVLVLEQHANGAFLGLLDRGAEAGLELGRLDLVQHLEADGAPGVLVARLPHLGHAALAGAIEQLEALADVDTSLAAAAAEQVAQEPKDTHSSPPIADDKGTPRIRNQ